MILKIIACGRKFEVPMFALFGCHSRAGGNPLQLGRWIPVFTCMTISFVCHSPTFVRASSAQAGIHSDWEDGYLPPQV
jgi:hypothetical protein